MIKLNIKHQKLEITETSYLANRSHNYLKILFNFNTDDWADKTKYCIITDNKDNNRLFIIEDDNSVVLPSAVLKGNYFKISAYGVKDEIRITTNQIRIKLAESGYTQDITPISDDSEDVFSYLLEQLDSKVSHAELENALSHVPDINMILDYVNDNI